LECSETPVFDPKTGFFTQKEDFLAQTQFFKTQKLEISSELISKLFL